MSESGSPLGNQLQPGLFSSLLCLPAQTEHALVAIEGPAHESCIIEILPFRTEILAADEPSRSRQPVGLQKR